MIRNLPIVVPELPEQERIVEILEDHLSRLDAALADVKQAKLKSAQFRRSLLHTAFAGTLSMTVPGGWKSKTLDEITSFISDGSHNPPKGIDYSEYLMLSSRDIQDGYIEIDRPRFLSKEDFDKENTRTRVQRNDVLLTSVGTIGRAAVYSGTPEKVTFQRSVTVIRPTPEDLIPKFLMYWLLSAKEILVKESRGVAQQGIYLNQVRKLTVPVPTLPEQERIVKILEDHLSRLDESMKIAEYIESSAAALRRSLLQAAFTGQLTKEEVNV
jgi:type I restriction enzyme S subunit